MQVLGAPIVGREAELGIVRQFVGKVGSGPRSLVLEGVAGIGKTAIWSETVSNAAADGLTVWQCRCTEPESAWAFAGLGDLLDGLGDDALASLPAVQRRALSAALLLSDPAQDASGRIVGAALLNVLRGVTGAGPVLMAIDDVQWLDPSSRTVLTYALRRLRVEPVRLLVSFRTESAGGGGIGADLGIASDRLVVGPVSVGLLHRIVSLRLERVLSRQSLTRLHRATGGNPMMCLEMARAMQRRGAEPAVGEPLPVPADFRVLVTERLAGLEPGAIELVLLSAALARPTFDLLASAVGNRAEAASRVAEAVRAGILECDNDRIRFTHPLIASIPYADLSSAERRRLHGRLAALVSDPEERARHAALGSSGPSGEIAAALEVASQHARRRGSLDAAAELAELAVARTPEGDVTELLRRTVTASEYLLLLGDPQRAQAVLTSGLESAKPGPERVPGLLLQATIASWERGDATVSGWCEMAIIEAAEDPLLLARCHATFSETSPAGPEADLAHARAAATLLDAMDSPPPDLLASALTNLAVHGFRLGRGLDVATLERAVRLEAESRPLPISDRAGMGLGMFSKMIDRFEESRRWLDVMARCAEDEGDDSAVPLILGHLAMLECWSGNYALALTHATVGREHAARMGFRSPMPASAQALALAHQGGLKQARDLAEADILVDESLGFLSAVALHLRSLGFAELMAADPEAASTHLSRALTISSEIVGIGEPAIMRLHGDLVAALVSLGRVDDANAATSQLDASTHAHHHPWSTAIAGRCHGLIHASLGECTTALEFLEQSLLDHRMVPMPFEEARTRALYAATLRRAGHRTDARREFGTALSVFERLGAPVQARQVRAELATIGGRRSITELTHVETRISDLVASGHTNREVAGLLFVSVRTVEGHLARVYRKLDVRSRTELARWVTSRSS